MNLKKKLASAAAALGMAATLTVAATPPAEAAVPWSELYRNSYYWGRGHASGNVQASGPRYVNVYCSDGRVYYSGTRWGAGQRVTAYCPFGRKALNSAMSFNNRIIHWA